MSTTISCEEASDLARQARSRGSSAPVGLNHQVRGFEVAMNDLMLVGVRDRVDNLHLIVNRRLDGQRPIR